VLPEQDVAMKKKVLIIGAGVSGLASACRLASMGYKVTVCEKNDRPGGRMGLVEAQGFRFDLGPTIVMMPQIYREVFSDCGKNPEDYLQMERLDPIYRVWFEDGTVHEASSELSTLIPELEAFSESETAGYLEYLSNIYKRYLIAKDYFIGKGFRRRSDFYNLPTLKAGLKLKTFKNAFDSVGEFVKTEKMRELLAFQTLYIGISPYNGPSIYTIIPMIELVYGVWFIRGGMRGMADAMSRLLTDLGGEILLNTPVETILHDPDDKKRVTGVRAGGMNISADIVLCSADFPYAMQELLPETFKHGKYSPRKMNKLEYSCSCFMMYLGLDSRAFENLNVHNLVFSSDFKGNLQDIFEGRFPADASIYVYAPALKDESLAPEGQLGLYVLVPVPNLADGKLEWSNPEFVAGCRNQAFEKIRRIKPLANFEKHVIMERIFTPEDFRETFNAAEGATFGLKPTLMQSNYWRPQPKAMKYDNLYFTGSSIHPGAGVPIVLTSAKIAVDEIVKDDK
jgi:phytoene desaturase